MAGEETKQTTGTDMNTVIATALANFMSGGGGAVGSNLVYRGPTGGTKTVRLKRTGQAVSMPEPDVTTTQQLITMYLNNPKMQSDWRKTMQRNGLETGNPIAERKVFEAAVAGASDWYTTSNMQQKVTPEDYLRWYAGGVKKAAPKADLTRQIYTVTPEQIDADINDVAQKVLGRTITDNDKQAEWYSDLVNGITKMAGRGTTTEVKTVRNKKTGKLERQVIQTPEVTKEAIAERITSAVEAADPASLERRQNLDFANWAFQKMGGRG